MKGPTDRAFVTLHDKITLDKWQGLQEMEAIVRPIATYSKSEAQVTDRITCSFQPLFHSIITSSLQQESFQAIKLGRQCSYKRLDREEIPVNGFSAFGKKCLLRLKGQVMERLQLTLNDTLTTFADPRTAAFTEQLASSALMHGQAFSKFRSLHRKIYLKLLHDDRSPPDEPVLEVEESDDDGDDGCGFNIKFSPPSEEDLMVAKEKDADDILEKYLCSVKSIDWKRFKYEDVNFEPKLSTAASLFNYCDPLLWWKTEGQTKFPL